MQGSKRKKVPGSGSHNWDSYLRKVLQDNHPGVKITKEAMQVWAEALDAWLQQLAQEIVQEHTSQSLTPAMSKHPYSSCWQKVPHLWRTQHLQNLLSSTLTQALDRNTCYSLVLAYACMLLV